MVTGLELIKLSVLSISFHFVINSIARDFSWGGGEGKGRVAFITCSGISSDSLYLRSCLLYSSALLLACNQSVPNTDLAFACKEFCFQVSVE